MGASQKRGRARKTPGETVSVVGGERKKRASEEKKGRDCLGSWGRAKKAGEGGKKGGTLLVVGGERKKRASEEKKGEDCLGSWG